MVLSSRQKTLPTKAAVSIMVTTIKFESYIDEEELKRLQLAVVLSEKTRSGSRFSEPVSFTYYEQCRQSPKANPLQLRVSVTRETQFVYLSEDKQLLRVHAAQVAELDGANCVDRDIEIDLRDRKQVKLCRVATRQHSGATPLPAFIASGRSPFS